MSLKNIERASQLYTSGKSIKSFSARAKESQLNSTANEYGSFGFTGSERPTNVGINLSLMSIGRDERGVKSSVFLDVCSSDAKKYIVLAIEDLKEEILQKAGDKMLIAAGNLKSKAMDEAAQAMAIIADL